MDKQQSYEDKLEALQRDYQDMLPSRLDEIRKAWADVLASDDRKALDQEVLEDCIRYVHSLAGSGSTFGYEQLSSVAKQLEDVLRKLTQEIDAEQRAGVQVLIEQLADAAGQSAQQSSPSSPEAPSKPVNLKGKSLGWFGLDQDIADEATAYLGRFGFDLHHADQTDTLIETFSAAKPAIVVVDLYELDENQLKEVIGCVERLAADYPVVVLAPNQEGLDIWLQAHKAGCVACFSKPLDLFSLVERIDEVLRPQDTSPYRLFIVDDDKDLVKHMAAILEKTGMVVAYETDPRLAYGRLHEFQPDLILIDLYMPVISGVQLARIIRQDKRFVGTPIVYLSRETESAKQLEALKAGADDFIPKPVRYKYLYYSLSSRIDRARQLQTVLRHDILTGLPTHTAIQDRLSAEVAKAAETGNALAFIHIDIDDFKTINDRFGHAEGDRLLKSLAIMLRRRLGKDAISGRYGGEEFAVILRNRNMEQTKAILDELRQQFGGMVHRTANGDYSATLSAGFATFPAYSDVYALSDAADRALANAKFTGKNRVVGLDPPQPVNLYDTNTAEEDLILLDEEDEAFDVLEDTATTDLDIKIVVVDDDPQLLQHIAAMMGEKGFTVWTAATGEEGFDIAKAQRPDLVLTDLLLFPGIHGFELCQKIREDEDLKTTKIILMTAVYKDYRYRIEGKEAGADEFIEKPINYPDLFQKIAALLPEYDDA